MSFNMVLFLLKETLIFVLEDLHLLAKCSLASNGLLCEQWNSTLGIRHSQFAYTIGGSILWRAGMSRGGAKSLFFFHFVDSLENGTHEHFRFCFNFFSPLSLLSESTGYNTSKTDWQLSMAASKKKKRQTS